MRFLLNIGRQRLAALGMLCTGVVCPCHVLAGIAGLLTGGTLLSPAAQDGLHAVYVPLAVLSGTLLLVRHADAKETKGENPS